MMLIWRVISLSLLCLVLIDAALKPAFDNFSRIFRGVLVESDMHFPQDGSICKTQPKCDTLERADLSEDERYILICSWM